MKPVVLLLTLLAVLSDLPVSAAVDYPVVKGSVIFEPPSNQKFARRSEGAFITLKKGNIMHIYNRFKAKCGKGLIVNGNSAFRGKIYFGDYCNFNGMKIIGTGEVQ